MQDFFMSIAKRLSNTNNIDISGCATEFDIFETLVAGGISEETIINNFTTAINLPYENILDKPFAKSAIYPGRIESVKKHVRVFPFYNEEYLMVAISEPSQMDYADDLISDKEYMFCFSFQFLIDSRLEEDSGDFSSEVVPSAHSFETGVQAAEMGVASIETGNQTILLASGVPEIDAVISGTQLFTSSYIPLGEVQHRSNLKESCEAHSPDILLVGHPIGGTQSLTGILLSLHSDFPEMRIVYLAGELSANDEYKYSSLAALASAGIYDIITKDDISVPMVKDFLDNPMSKKDVEYLSAKLRDSGLKKKTNIKMFVPDSVEDDDSVVIYPNLFAISAPKGGTGKTFITENIAIAIATLGTPRLNGESPKIAIIDLDFQGFSISKFFNALDDQDNIFEAIKEVEKIIDPKLGSVLADVAEVTTKFVNERIQQMFRPVGKYHNIKMLAGTDVVYKSGQMSTLSPYILTYIIETIVEDYDVILIDMNTDIENSSVYPLYNFANCVYNVLDMNWNTFHAYKRVRTYLESKSLYIPSQTSYILNKAVFGEELYISIKDIEAGLGVSFSAIIPELSGVSMFNMSCKSDNVIQHADEKLAIARYYLLDIANKIYPIKNFDLLELEYADHKLINEKTVAKKEVAKKEEKSKIDIKTTIENLKKELKKFVPKKKQTEEIIDNKEEHED